MGVLDRLLRRTDYDVLAEMYRQAVTGKAEAEARMAELKQDLQSSRAELSSAADKLRKEKLFIVPADIRGKLFRELLLSGETDFENINGAGIYLADRHPTVYELVNTIYVDCAMPACSGRGCTSSSRTR
jgi:hypothetical protein